MHRLATDLFPLHRSISGEGVRQTLRSVSQQIPLTIHEVPTGTQVFDWTIPQEWRLRDAFIADAAGTRIVDVRNSNLHIVNYSQPVNATLSGDALRPFLHTLPERPHAIPYRTTYFRDQWGFCVDADQYQQLVDGGPWQVVIDADFFDGSLTMGDLEIRGSSARTVLFHSHTCHPSLANDNLSGMVVATALAEYLRTCSTRLSYRFVFAPATIGAIAWLAQQPQDRLQKIDHGLVLSLLGDSAEFTYKQTRSESATIDRLVPRVLDDLKLPYRVRAFSPDGYDERQYGSPGINLNVGRISRSEHSQFPQYHTSDDNLQFISPESLAQSLQVMLAIVAGLENNRYPINRFPFGEPQLGRHGIYRSFGTHDDRGRLQEAMLWVLNLGDGRNDLLAIAQRSRLPWSDLCRAVDLLGQHELIELCDHPVCDNK